MITVGDLFILYGLILLVTVGYIVGVIIVAYLLCYFANLLIEKINLLIEKMRNLRHGHKNSV